jgi:ABC-type glycerol-3-phosphate transport system substrate-binding protein
MKRLFPGIKSMPKQDELCKVRPVKASVLLSLVIASSFFGGCSSIGSNPFPKVTQPSETAAASATSTQTAASEIPSETSAQGMPVLRVAAPITNATAQYLLKLYTAKQSGILGEGVDGSNVSLQVLDSVKPAFSVEILQTPSSGVMDDTLKRWQENGIYPDIVLTGALSSLYAAGTVVPLTDYLASNPLLVPTDIYRPMLQALTIDGELCGIPYSASAKILFANRDVLSKAGINTVPFELDLNTLLLLSESVSKLNSETTLLPDRLFAFYEPSELLPFLPSSFSGSADWFMYNGSAFEFNASSFRKAVEFLRSYVSAGYSVESLTPEQRAEAFATLDPRLSGNVAMWVGSTEDISLWTNTAFSVSISQIPSETKEKDAPLPLTVYPLSITSSCTNPQLASDFAAFIALDTDAILLTIRLEGADGMLPVVTSDAVWETMVEKQAFGGNLMLLKSKMKDAYFDPVTNSDLANRQITKMLSDYKSSLIDETQDLDTLIHSLSTAGLQIS